MTVVSPIVLAFAIAFLVVGTLTAVVAVGVLTRFVVTNRKERLARHESVRTYYRAALIH